MIWSVLRSAAVIVAEWTLAALIAVTALSFLLWALRQRQRAAVQHQAALTESFARAQAQHRLEGA